MKIKIKFIAVLIVLSLLAVPVLAQDTVDTVILASTANYPDALIARAASEHSGAALLLTPRDGLSDEVKNVLSQLNPTEVVVVGGPAVVSDNVISELEGLGYDTVRLWGVTRFGTSAEVAKYFWPEGALEAVLVAGQEIDQAVPDEGDAGILSEVVSSKEGIPVLLAPGKLSVEVAAALEDLGVEKVSFIGDVEVKDEAKIESSLNELKVKIKEKIMGRLSEVREKLKEKLKEKVKATDELLVVAVSDFRHIAASAALGLRNHRTYLISSEGQIQELVDLVNSKGITKVEVVGKPELVDKIVAELKAGTTNVEIKQNKKEAKKADILSAEEVVDKLESIRERFKERKEKLEEKRKEVKERIKEKAENLLESLKNLKDNLEDFQKLLDEAESLLQEKPVKALKTLRKVVHLVKKSNFDKLDSEELREEVKDEIEDLKDTVEDLTKLNKDFGERMREGLTVKERLKIIEDFKLERKEKVRALVKAAGRKFDVRRIRDLRRKKLEELRERVRERSEDKKKGIELEANIDLSDEVKSAMRELYNSLKGIDVELKLKVKKEDNKTIMEAEITKGTLTSDQESLWSDFQAKVKALVDASRNGAEVEIGLESENKNERNGRDIRRPEDREKESDETGDSEESDREEVSGKNRIRNLIEKEVSGKNRVRNLIEKEVSGKNRVRITSSGFDPATITVKKGSTVTFINRDARKHWPASAVHPTHTVYPESTGKCAAIGGSDFDACKGLSNGETWSFNFNEVGEWKYHDHLNPRLTGSIIVEE